MLSSFELIALLLTMSAIIGWLNHRFIQLPHAIGMVLFGLAASLMLVVIPAVFPHVRFTESVSMAVKQIDFSNVVMNGMLSFLIFAGALGLDVAALKDRAWPVVVLAVFGTLISTAIVGGLFWAAAGALGIPVPLPWAFVFGALISPTDPVAVLSMLKGVRLPGQVKIELQGEALFNDGIGVVLFVLLVGLASGSFDPESLTVLGLGKIILIEVGGGLAIGLVAGYAAYRAMRAIDDFAIEALITLALVAGTYALSQRLGASGPLAMVAAGLLVGHRAPKDAMTDTTKHYVTTLWTLIDEVLNSILFLLIGLEVLILGIKTGDLWLAVLSVPIALAARLLSIAAPVVAFAPDKRLSMRRVPFLAWAGVRGGISVALALSLPATSSKPAIVAATYAVVLFTLVVQGSTLGRVARLTLPELSGVDRKTKRSPEAVEK